MIYRRGRSRREQAGYTILEVMMVLAITIALFAAAATSFMGRQASAEFTQAVRNYEAKLENIMSEVVNGAYERNNCPIIGLGTGDCIFLGKTLQPNGNTTEIHTVVGKRYLDTNKAENVTTFLGANPQYAGTPETYNHTFQLSVTRIARLDDDTALGVIGIILPVLGSDGGGKLAEVYGAPNINDPSILNKIQGGVRICLRGQNGQYAEIKLGEASSGSAIMSELGLTGGPCHDT